MIDFLKVLVALLLLAAAITAGFAAAGVFGAACGVALWWLCASIAES